MLYSIGFSREDLHDPDAALLSFTDALQRDPTLWPASWARAELLQARREYGSALQDWNQVVAQRPALAQAYLWRGNAASNLGRQDAAIADYTKAITIASPNDAVDEFYEERGTAQAAAHRPDLAIQDFDQAIARNERAATAYAGRGRSLFLKGDAIGAVSDFRKASELAPDDLYDALWLYLAETESGQDGAGNLRGRMPQLPMTRWPGPLVRVLLGDIKPEQVQPAPPEPAGWSAADRQAGAACELAFFTGELHRLQGRKDQAIAAFRAALATHVLEYVEYPAAEAELARLTR
ncbi:MAG TPA: tetratricopeptide repeat protein [Aliidongia sp.]|uniref:tetratricopeptide repeat protein n=1 Tax=Aliidongia sp. TaxID=1914230 RepID=UPI002DDD1CD7|nr:tetratricopeptide repeat protein [Aliidongia sp.]HEV2676325.1 tetratricopeptide repeat protein [Aliidongia sp.]